MTFGSYPQTIKGTDRTPIEWIVLDYDEANHKALLLSKYGLEAKPYNTEWAIVTWETCTLRSWLNNDFLNKAFSAEEQSAILTTAVDNSAGQGYSGWSTDGGNNTQDKIFLLSYAEANRYLGVKYWKDDDGNNTKSRVAPTNYAIKTGADTNSGKKTSDGTPAGWWWLRSPGTSQDRAADVISGGSLRSSRVYFVDGVIRPAFWLNLDCSNQENTSKPAASGTAESTASSTAEPNAAKKISMTLGDVITFGTYPQTAAGTDSMPIEWIVLDYDEANHKALLLSKYGLEAKTYNNNPEYTVVTWEICSLRAWLNNDFLNKAFSVKEQSAILTTEVDNSISQGYSEWHTDGGNNTQDKIFLLSCAEANRYLNVKYWEDDDGKNTKSRVAPTEYALQNGAWASYSDQTADGKPAGCWWLRSPGLLRINAALVVNSGSLYYYNVGSDLGVVRPAFWLNLDSGIF